MTLQVPDYPPIPWVGILRDGETFVKIADVLDWLRSAETAWAHCRDDSPAKVAGHLADTVRDVWFDAQEVQR